jgi:uncharacterized protein YcfJ
MGDTLKQGWVVLVILFFSAFSGLAQDKKNKTDDKVHITSSGNKTAAQINRDKEHCYSDTKAQFDHSKHKTLKNTGAGAAGGGVVGGVFGHGKAGAAAGAAAGAYRGHKKSKENRNEFNELYAFCLREKGYSVEVKE